MSISLLTLVLLLLFVFWIIVNKKVADIVEKIVVLVMALSLFTQSGYALTIGSFSVSFGILFSTLGALVCVVLLAIGPKQLNRIQLSGMLMILFSTISLGALAIFKYQVVRYSGNVMPWDTYYNYSSSIVSEGIVNNNWLTYAKTVCYCIMAITAHRYLDIKRWRKIIVCFSKLSKVTIIYGIIELGFIYVLRKNLYYTITRYIVGQSNATYIGLGDSRGVSYMLQGLTREPSHYAVQLLIILLILLAANEIERSKNIKGWIITVIILMLLSMSFTSLLMLAVFSFIWFLYKSRGKNSKKKLVAYGMGFCILVMSTVILGFIIESSRSSNFYVMRIQMTFGVLQELFSGKELSANIFSTSPGCRLASSIGTLRYFIKYFFLGLGPGTTISHTLTSYTLANYGIIACFFWMKLTFSCGISKGKALCSEYKLAVGIFFASFLFAGGIEINSLCYLIVANCIMVLFLKGEIREEV